MKRVVSFPGGQSEAAWLDKWVSEHVPDLVELADGDARATLAEDLARDAEEAAKRDGVSMRPALRMKGYSTLSDYLHDVLDENADD